MLAHLELILLFPLIFTNFLILGIFTISQLLLGASFLLSFLLIFWNFVSLPELKSTLELSFVRQLMTNLSFLKEMKDLN
jgi:hypothetical protein